MDIKYSFCECSQQIPVRKGFYLRAGASSPHKSHTLSWAVSVTPDKPQDEILAGLNSRKLFLSGFSGVNPCSQCTNPPQCALCQSLDPTCCWRRSWEFLVSLRITSQWCWTNSLDQATEMLSNKTPLKKKPKQTDDELSIKHSEKAFFPLILNISHFPGSANSAHGSVVQLLAADFTLSAFPLL